MNYIEYMKDGTAGGGIGDTLQVTLPYYLRAVPFKRVLTEGPNNAYMLKFASKNEKIPTNNTIVSAIKSKLVSGSNGDSPNNGNNTLNISLANLMDFDPNMFTSLGNK